jgi:hypothetical protein
MENQNNAGDLEKEFFCKHQLYVNRRGEKSFSFGGWPNNPESVLACNFYLSKEDYVFPCPYKYDEIYLDTQTGKLKIAHRDEKGNPVKICNNFSAPSHNPESEYPRYRDEHGMER